MKEENPMSRSARRFSRALRTVLGGLVVLAAIGAAGASAQSGGAVAQRLDTIAGAAVREIRSVGISAAVVRGSETLLLEAYGRADVDAGTPLLRDTVLAIGSVTKQFTAA